MKIKDFVTKIVHKVSELKIFSKKEESAEFSSSNSTSQSLIWELNYLKHVE